MTKNESAPCIEATSSISNGRTKVIKKFNPASSRSVTFLTVNPVFLSVYLNAPKLKKQITAPKSQNKHSDRIISKVQLVWKKSQKAIIKIFIT